MELSMGAWALFVVGLRNATPVGAAGYVDVADGIFGAMIGDLMEEPLGSQRDTRQTLSGLCGVLTIDIGSM